MQHHKLIGNFIPDTQPASGTEESVWCIKAGHDVCCNYSDCLLSKVFSADP